ncbi:MAG: type VI secretion system baseplate subunit TssG [Oleibacter sp.]|nr:type VI secretion system baseplate subunit TssG [Thalassolituus sp.]|tara:strand:+ start:17252 stop:18235 length:984 start_codon:yes stop_codon:yes gene_type:complete
MAVEISEELKFLEEDILNDAQAYEFFQAYRILNKINAQYPVSPRRPARTISVRPELGLGYSETDVSKVERLEKDAGYEIITQISGLYGLSSPLPDFYNEELLDNEWEELNAPREFLDIIHSQLLPKLYDAWSLFKLNFNAIEHDRDSYWHMLYSLLGLVNDTDSPAIARLKLRYFGLYSKAERSAAGLKILVQDYLQLDSIKVEEFVAQNTRIPAALRLQLGTENHQLGESAHLGSQIIDQNNCIRIHTGELDQQAYEAIVNDSERMTTLSTLVSSYLKKPLKTELVFNVTPSSPMASLGYQWNSLGINTYMRNDQSPRSISYPLTC